MAYAPPSFVSGYPPGAAPVHYPTAPGAPQASSGTHGTVVPAPNFNPIADAEALRKAMKGFGTDEKAIIEVLTHRSAAQRLEIAKAFKMSFGKDLIADLKSELTGNFEDVIVALVQERSHYEAACLRKAMKGAGTDDHVLIELILTRSNAEIKATKAAYTEQFHRDLEADVSSETSGYFRRILVSALQAFRPDTATVDVAQAQQDAKALFEAGEKRFGTDESVFNQILMSRSPAQLRATFQEYYNLSHHDILHAIENEMSGDVKKAYKAIAHSVIDAPAFFAGRLYKSMDGVGTADDDLIRLVVTRSEVDMVEIKAAFEKEFGKTLARMIEGDCKGDYKRALLALIGA